MKVDVIRYLNKNHYRLKVKSYFQELIDDIEAYEENFKFLKNNILSISFENDTPLLIGYLYE